MRNRTDCSDLQPDRMRIKCCSARAPSVPTPCLLVTGDPDQIKTQLGEVLDLQDEGKNNMTIKLKKKALQGAQTDPQKVCLKVVH